MNERRLALTCDTSGRILEVIRDDYEVTHAQSVGSPLVSLVPNHKISECFRLLDSIRTELAIYGWMFDIETDTTIENLYIAGLYDNGKYFLVTSESLEDIEIFNRELIEINNEYANSLRSLIKTKYTEEKSKDNTAIYDQLSELGNEISTLQRQLAKSNKDLERALEDKNILLRIASHDLGNPIESINICCSILRNPDVNPDQRRKVIDYIQEYSDHMSLILNSTINIISIDSEYIEINKERIDLASLIVRVISLNQMIADRKKIKIEFSPDIPLHIHGDSVKLLQAINNLVANSVKYTPPGKSIQISLSTQNQMVSIEIRDEGIGINRTDIDKIFREFVRLYEESPSEQHSWGLGLAIVKRIIETHGGTIQVESEVGLGTTFRVLLPLA